MERKYDRFLGNGDIGIVQMLGDVQVPLCDISAGGLCLVWPESPAHPLAEGEDVKVRLSNSNVKNAEVVWTKSSQAGSVSVGAKWSNSLSVSEITEITEDLHDTSTLIFEHGLSGPNLLRDIVGLFGRSNPLSNIMRRVVAAGCDFVKAEAWYVDFRSSEGYESFFHKYARVGPPSIRLHLWQQDAGAGHGPRYFGYVTIRNLRLKGATTRLGQIGRTLLEFPEAALNDPVIGRVNDEAYFINAPQYRYSTGGLSGTLECFEYRQQNAVTGTCGHTAIETASGVLARRFRTKPLTSLDVHAAAKTLGYVGREVVADLMEDQLGAALATTGGNVKAYFTGGAWGGSRGYGPRRKATKEELCEILHVATDSYLPAVAILTPRHGSRHVVTVVGHTATRAPRPIPTTRRKSVLAGFTTTTHWVKDLLIHDDSVGPYLRIPLRKSDVYKNGETPRYDAVWNMSVESNLRAVFVTYPPGVILDGLDAINLASAFCIKSLEVMGQAGEHGELFNELVRADNEDELVFSTYLDLTNRFRERMLTSEGGSIEDAELLIETPLPEHVYVVSISTKQRIGGEGSFEATCLGYVVVDPTAHSSSEEAVMLARLGNVVLILGENGHIASVDTGFTPCLQPLVAPVGRLPVYPQND